MCTTGELQKIFKKNENNYPILINEWYPTDIISNKILSSKIKTLNIYGCFTNKNKVILKK